MLNASFLFITITLGILISNHGNNAISSSMEPCRIAPYVVQANIRQQPATTSSSSVSSATSISTSFPSTTFSAFDPALITAAAHQVAIFLFINLLSIKYFILVRSGSSNIILRSKFIFATTISLKSSSSCAQ